MKAARHLWVALVLFGPALPGIASGQDVVLDSACRGASELIPTHPTEGAGAEAFAAGLAAAEDERWADAATAFRRCFDESGSRVALYNLGHALRSLNRHVEARAAFCMVARDGDFEESARREAAVMAVQEAARIGTLRLEDVEPVPSELLVELDGVGVGSVIPLELQVDAEVPHTLSVEAPRYERFTQEVTLRPGQTLEVSIDLVLEPSAGEDFVGSAGFWGLMVGVVVLAAGGAVLGGFLYEDAQFRPTSPDTSFRF